VPVEVGALVRRLEGALGLGIWRRLSMLCRLASRRAVSSERLEVEDVDDVDEAVDVLETVEASAAEHIDTSASPSAAHGPSSTTIDTSSLTAGGGAAGRSTIGCGRGSIGTGAASETRCGRGRRLPLVPTPMLALVAAAAGVAELVRRSGRKPLKLVDELGLRSSWSMARAGALARGMTSGGSIAEAAVDDDAPFVERGVGIADKSGAVRLGSANVLPPRAIGTDAASGKVGRCCGSTYRRDGLCGRTGAWMVTSSSSSCCGSSGRESGRAGDAGPGATGDDAERWMRLAVFLRGLRKSMSSSSESDSTSSSLRVSGVRPVSERGERAPRVGDERGTARRCDDEPAMGVEWRALSTTIEGEGPPPKMPGGRAAGERTMATDPTTPRLAGETRPPTLDEAIISSKLSWIVGSSASVRRAASVPLATLGAAPTLVALAERGSGLTSRSRWASAPNDGRPSADEGASWRATTASRASAFDEVDLRGLWRWPWTGGPVRTTPMPVILLASTRL